MIDRGIGLLFPYVFYGLISRWILKINAMALGNVQSDISGYIRRNKTSWCTLHNVPRLFLAVTAIDLCEFNRRTKCFISTAANRPSSELTQRTDTHTLIHTHWHRNECSVSATALRASRCCFSLILAILMGLWLPLKGKTFGRAAGLNPSLISPGKFSAPTTPRGPLCAFCTSVCVCVL